MAPAVAMAADTPHIETALASMVENSSSTFIFRDSQKAKYHTTVTTITAWISPNAPAVRIYPEQDGGAEQYQSYFYVKLRLHT